MEKKINLKDVLEKFDKYNCISEAQLSDIIPAMREACRQILELAAENAETENKVKRIDILCGAKYNTVSVIVNKQSILDTIKQIK